MQKPVLKSGTVVRPPDDATNQAGAEPKRRRRERSGTRGEPAGIPPGSEGTSDGSERDYRYTNRLPKRETTGDGDHLVAVA